MSYRSLFIWVGHSLNCWDTYIVKSEVNKVRLNVGVCSCATWCHPNHDVSLCKWILQLRLKSHWQLNENIKKAPKRRWDMIIYILHLWRRKKEINEIQSYWSLIVFFWPRNLFMFPCRNIWWQHLFFLKCLKSFCSLKLGNTSCMVIISYVNIFIFKWQNKERCFENRDRTIYKNKASLL